MRAFQVFDVEDLHVEVAHACREVSSISLGQQMLTEDVDAILREAEIDEEGQFSYKTFAMRLCEGLRKIPDL